MLRERDKAKFFCQQCTEYGENEDYISLLKQDKLPIVNSEGVVEEYTDEKDKDIIFEPKHTDPILYMQWLEERQYRKFFKCFPDGYCSTFDKGKCLTTMKTILGIFDSLKKEEQTEINIENKLMDELFN